VIPLHPYPFSFSFFSLFFPIGCSRLPDTPFNKLPSPMVNAEALSAPPPPPPLLAASCLVLKHRGRPSQAFVASSFRVPSRRSMTEITKVLIAFLLYIVVDKYDLLFSHLFFPIFFFRSPTKPAFFFRFPFLPSPSLRASREFWHGSFLLPQNADVSARDSEKHDFSFFGSAPASLFLFQGSSPPLKSGGRLPSKSIRNLLFLSLPFRDQLDAAPLPPP